MDKGISLRKKRSVRPKISAPQQIRAPLPALPVPDRSRLQQNNSSKTSLAPSQASSQAVSISHDHVPKEKTADFVKRRYSTKLTIAPKDFDIPALPSLPSQFSSVPQDSRSREKVEVDIRALQNPNLEVEKYVTHLLANATEQDIRDYQHELRGVKGRTSTNIQESVYQNRTQFIKISQEAEKLKGEMRALRALMSDLTNTLGQTNAALGITADTPKARKGLNRSSVANLEAMWSTQLQELWRRVEGSQKFLPAIPGRHVVHESGRWIELNSATWKQKRRVHIVLLNDHFLVAVEKQRADDAFRGESKQKVKGSMPTQLLVERCWPLLDVQIADLSTRANIGINPQKPGVSSASNAINARFGSEALTYATVDSDSPEKANFLAKFRKTTSELKKIQHAEAEERALVRNSAYAFVPSDTENNRSRLSAIGSEQVLGRVSMLIEVDGKQQNFRWVENQVDELDIDVALQRFEEAVLRVEKLRNIAKTNKSNSLVQDLINTRVQERATKLAAALTRQLVDTSASMTSTAQYVTWLIKLGFSARASEAYLQSRSAVTQKRTSQCTHQGDLQQYLYQISFIYFTIIRNTVSTYQHCFPQVMMSACVKWAKEQIDSFNIIFSAQTSTLAQNDEERQRCLELAREHAATLSEIGLDFTSLVGHST